uniref:Microtubule-associated protein 1S n=1 Tax=Peromyscus maniculatus bairdii TaxID=230844 RepID=A0A8C8UKI0_PERMB
MHSGAEARGALQVPGRPGLQGSSLKSKRWGSGGECCPASLGPSFIRDGGVRSWEDVDPAVCSLDEQLKAFVSRHSATFSSIVKVAS